MTDYLHLVGKMVLVCMTKYPDYCGYLNKADDGDFFVSQCGYEFAIGASNGSHRLQKNEIIDIQELVIKESQ